MRYNGKDYHKIIIVGSAGSGKSYLSKRIADITGQPLIHLDNEFWKPDWVMTPKAEWIVKQQELISTDEWIIDGNYCGTLELRYKVADCIILMDTNRFLCIYRVWKRHGKKRSDLPDYLVEKKDKEFFEFLKFVWDFPKTDRNKIFELHDRYPQKMFIRIKGKKELNEFMRQISK